MIECVRCQNVSKYDSDIIGKNYRGILFVLHKADHRVFQQTLFDKPLFGTKTGRVISELLDVADLNIEDVIITNFYKCIKQGDPTKKEYQNCVGIFEEQFRELSPDKMVLFGAPVYKFITGDPDFEGNIGKLVEYNSLDAYVSHHPSKIGTILRKEKQRILKHLAEYLR